MAIVSRALTAFEKKLSPVEVFLSASTYALRRLRRYVEYAPYVVVSTPLDEVGRLAKD